MGSNINLQDNGGWTSLHYAVSSNSLESINLLLSNDANISIADKNSRTAKDIADERGFINIVQLLNK